MAERDFNRAVVCVNKNVKDYDSLAKYLQLDPQSLFWVIGQKMTELKDTTVQGDAKTEPAVYDVTFVQVDYDKQVYRPGEVTLTFTATKKSPVDKTKQSSTTAFSKILKKSYLSKKFYIDVVGFKGTLVDSDTTIDELVSIAQNYYIQSFSVGPNPNPVTGSAVSSSYQYSLKCFSLDKKLTLDRYCNVYEGQCVSSGLCAKKLAEDWKDIVKDLEVCATAEYVKLSSIPGQQAKKRDISLYACSVDRLMLLGYTIDGKNYTRTKKKDPKDVSKYIQHANELKHPYLVQYNESFYDFISRVLHRCGEFFYFEKGRLCIGLPADTMAVLDSGSAAPAYNGALPICEYEEISLGDESVQSVQTFAENYIVSPGALFKPSDTNKKNMPYDAYMSSDENLYRVSETDYSVDSFKMWIVYSWMDMFFKSNFLLEGLISASIMTIVNVIVVNAWIPKKLKDKMKEKYVYDSKNNKNVPDSSYDVRMADDMCNDLYRQVENWENISGRKKVKMSFSTNLPNLYLAQAINLNDGIEENYVITRMFGKYTASSSENSAEAVPIIRLGDSAPGFMGKNVAVALPPPGVSHILKSSAMEAIVKANDDPLRIGRVRVIYPWQSNSSLLSPWIRVTVPYAGAQDKSSGFLMIPDKEEHVMLDYMGGNIERPFVNGSMYYVGDRPSIGAISPDHPLYWPQKQIRTIASGNGHYLSFTDGNDTNFLEAVFPPLKPIFNIAGGGSSAVKETGDVKSVGGAFAIKGGKIVMGDGSGMCSVGIFPGPRKVVINSSFGSVQIDAFTGISLTSPNGDINISAKNINITAGNNINIQSGTNIDRNPESNEYMGGMLFGTILGTAATTAVKMLGGVDLAGCFDFTFLRCLMDSFLRPVEGTLSLKSNRNTIMTTGAGKVTIPTDYLSQDHKWAVKKVDEKHNTTYAKFIKKEREADVAEQFFIKAHKAVTAVGDMVDAYFDDLCSHISEANRLLNTLTEEISSYGLMFKDENQNKLDRKGLCIRILSSQDTNGVFNDWLTPLYVKSFTYTVGKQIDDIVKEFKKHIALINPNDTDKSHNSFKPLVNKIKRAVSYHGSLSNEGLYFLYKFATFNLSIATIQYDKILAINGDNDIVDYLNQWENYVKRKKKVIKRAFLLQVLYLLCNINNSRIGLKRKNGTKWEPLTMVEGDTFSTCMETNHLADYLISDEDWSAFVNQIEEIHPHSWNVQGTEFFKSTMAAFAGSFGRVYDYSHGKRTFFRDVQYIFNLNGVAGPRTLLPSPGKGGGSLFISNNGGYSTKLNKDASGWERVDNPSPSFIKTYLNGN